MVRLHCGYNALSESASVVVAGPQAVGHGAAAVHVLVLPLPGPVQPLVLPLRRRLLPLPLLLRPEEIESEEKLYYDSAAACSRVRSSSALPPHRTRRHCRERGERRERGRGGGGGAERSAVAGARRAKAGGGRAGSGRWLPDQIQRPEAK